MTENEHFYQSSQVDINGSSGYFQVHSTIFWTLRAFEHGEPPKTKSKLIIRKRRTKRQSHQTIIKNSKIKSKRKTPNKITKRKSINNSKDKIQML